MRARPKCSKQNQPHVMLRISKAMTSVKRVPIPKNGVDYRGKIVLAPMVRSGELPSRLLALQYGADLVWGPETIAQSLVGTTRRQNEALRTIDFTRYPSSHANNPVKDQKESLIFRIHPEREGKKLIFQLGTSDPELAVKAARIVAADVAGIDVNAGCPKPFSTSGGMGAALLQTPDKLCSILEALVKEITSEFEIGISVKIRLLETPELTSVLVKRLCATGITGLTIHCRTTSMRPRQRALREQLKMIADICRENGVACLMNGDVENRAQAEQLVTEFGVDGAMIATAAEANSSVFKTEAEGGILPWKEVVKEYMKTCLEVENKFSNTKYLLGQLVPGKQAVYKEMTMSKSYHAICKLLEFEDLESRAQEVDETLGLTPEIQAQMGRRGRKNQSAHAAGGNQARNQAQSRPGKGKQGKKPLSERGVQNTTPLKEPGETAVDIQA